MDAVREVGKELVAAKPSELAVGNMVRKHVSVSCLVCRGYTRISLLCMPIL